MRGFFQLGFAEKSAREAERRRIEEERAADRWRREAERVAEIERKQALKVTYEFTKEDLDLAMAKVEETAERAAEETAERARARCERRARLCGACKGHRLRASPRHMTQARSLSFLTSTHTSPESSFPCCKVTEAAVKYDKNSPSAMSLTAFEGSSMPPHVFKEQLKRVFNIKLTAAELGALMKHFDKDGDGTVDCAEFLIAFFKKGFETRAANTIAKREAEAATTRKAQAIEEARDAAAAVHAAAQVSWTFTDADKDSALVKVRRRQ